MLEIQKELDQFILTIKNTQVYKEYQLQKSKVKENPDLIIVTDEVGYGIVPMDAKDREWREACGRVCTKLAAHAAQVVRVCCGIGTQLK